MIYDLQKASLLKRASAWLLDLILLSVLAVGVAALLSTLLNYDSHYDTLAARKEKYETEYNVSFDILQEEYDALPPEQQENYNAAKDALNTDEDALRAYNMIVNLSLIIVTFSVLAAYLGLEFAVPLLFGNGQTVGKKVFAIGVMKVDGVKINTVSLFVRTVLGKFTIETMVPLLLVLMMLFGLIGIMGPLVIFGIIILQIALMITSKTNSPIHDALAQTVTVDIHSQMIFGDEAQLLAYKKQVHEEMVRRQPY